LDGRVKPGHDAPLASQSHKKLRQYSDGVLPNAARKRALKVDRSEKPLSYAIVVTLSDVVRKRAAARRNRVAIRY
jgi:hypothetical protein